MVIVGRSDSVLGGGKIVICGPFRSGKASNLEGVVVVNCDGFSDSWIAHLCQDFVPSFVCHLYTICMRETAIFKNSFSNSFCKYTWVLSIGILGLRMYRDSSRTQDIFSSYWIKQNSDYIVYCLRLPSPPPQQGKISRTSTSMNVL